MATKPNAADWRVQEQIIDDPVSGLTLQFDLLPDGKPRLQIYGNLPFGNREIIFDHEGREAAAGTVFGDIHRPSWLQVVSP